MPQMAPMNWLSLYIMFSMMLIIFNVVNYFSFKYTYKKYPKKNKIMYLYWKW